MKLFFIIRCVKHCQHFIAYICNNYLSWLFAVGICHCYLQQLFAMGICRSIYCRNLPWLFAVGLFFVCKQTFFLLRKSFFFVNNSFLIESKLFSYESKSFLIYEIFFINIVSFCYCHGSYGPPYEQLFHSFTIFLK